MIEDYVITYLVTWWAVDLSKTYASLPLLQHIHPQYATKVVRISVVLHTDEMINHHTATGRNVLTVLYG